MQNIIYIFIFLLGTIIGSFLNCLVWRLHKNETLLGRSYCPKCLAKIFWHDNVPILSWLALGGKCRSCKNKISIQYPLVEILTGILFLLAFWLQVRVSVGYLDFLAIFRDWFVICVMTVIFIYDLRWYLVLDRVSLGGALVVFIVNLVMGVSFFDMFWVGLVGAGFFAFQFVVSQGRWIGGGDIRIGLLMGVIFARLDLLAMALAISYFAGSIVGLGLIASGRKEWGSKLPLGVFLAFGTVITLFWGDFILNWYLGLLY